MRLWTIILTVILGLSSGCDQPVRSRLTPYDQAIEAYRQRQAVQPSPSEPADSGRTVSLLIRLIDACGEDLTTLNTLWRLAEEERITPVRAELFTESGFRVGRAAASLRSQLKMLESRMTTARSKDLVVTVRDGSAGVAEIGSKILIPLFYYKNDLFSRMDYAFDRIDRRLRIVPRILSDNRMELELTPVLVNVRNDGGSTFLSDLSVKIVLDAAQSLFFGGSNTGRQDIASAFLTCDLNGQKGRTLVVITPTIQESSVGNPP
ncbi:MAG: hypothetical protein GX455_17205 [Phycisphaerae bacterium]|nr:hypothetical protein [Phycisphaerae bacterium]